MGATNESNQRASFSSYGAWVDVAAPGEHIWSLVQSNYAWDWLTQILFMLSYGWDGVNPYMYCDGTSMACPLVAGVAGLVKNRAPWMDSDDMQQHLIDTGDTVVYDQPIGKKVNAFQAVSEVATAAPGAPPAALAIDGSWPNPFNPKTTIRFHLAAAASARLAVYATSGREIRVLREGDLTAGEHLAVWDGRDAGGRPVASGMYFARLASPGLTDEQKLVLLK